MSSFFQEELSFVFEMLGLFEEARIQYLEIDAVLTQLVINSNAGGKLKRSQSSFLLCNYNNHFIYPQVH